MEEQFSINSLMFVVIKVSECMMASFMDTKRHFIFVDKYTSEFILFAK